MSSQVKRKRGRPPKVAANVGEGEVGLNGSGVFDGLGASAAGATARSEGESSDEATRAGVAIDATTGTVGSGEEEDSEAEYYDDRDADTELAVDSSEMRRSCDEPIFLVHMPVFLEKDFPYYCRAAQARGNVDNWPSADQGFLERELREIQKRLRSVSSVLRVENAKISLWPQSHSCDMYVSDVKEYMQRVEAPGFVPPPHTTAVALLKSEGSRSTNRTSLIDVVRESLVDPSVSGPSVVGYRCGIALAELAAESGGQLLMSEMDITLPHTPPPSHPAHLNGSTSTHNFGSTAGDLDSLMDMELEPSGNDRLNDLSKSSSSSNPSVLHSDQQLKQQQQQSQQLQSQKQQLLLQQQIPLQQQQHHQQLSPFSINQREDGMGIKKEEVKQEALEGGGSRPVAQSGANESEFERLTSTEGEKLLKSVENQMEGIPVDYVPALPMQAGMVRSMSEVHFESLRRAFAVNPAAEAEAKAAASAAGGTPGSAQRKRKKKDRESEPVLLRSKRQPTMHPFWKAAEVYFRDLGKDDLQLLQEEHENPNDPLWSIPKRGRHFSDVWDEEDALALQQRAESSRSAKRSAKNAAAAAWASSGYDDDAYGTGDPDYDDLGPTKSSASAGSSASRHSSRRGDAALGSGSLQASVAVAQRRSQYEMADKEEVDGGAAASLGDGSLVKRLLASLVDVQVLAAEEAYGSYPPANGDVESAVEGGASASTSSSATTTSGSTPAAPGATGSTTGLQFHSEASWPPNLPIVEGYDLDVQMELEHRLRAHLRAVGLLDDESLATQDSEDDELCCQLRALQKKLREQILVSNERKKRVRAMVIPFMKKQEDRRKIRERNAELERAYERVLRAQYMAKLAAAENEALNASLAAAQSNTTSAVAAQSNAVDS